MEKDVNFKNVYWIYFFLNPTICEKYINYFMMKKDKLILKNV